AGSKVSTGFTGAATQLIAGRTSPGFSRVPVAAGLARRRTAANTGEAGAMHRVVFFAGKPAPTEYRRSSLSDRWTQAVALSVGCIRLAILLPNSRASAS